MLYSSGQHHALRAVQSKLRPDERLFLQFSMTSYVASMPDRVSEIYKFLGEDLWRHSRIQIHAGKTQIWNSGGHVPEEGGGGRGTTFSGLPRLPTPTRGCGSGITLYLQRSVEFACWALRLEHWSYVQAQLRLKAASHRPLLERIPSTQDLQSAWLLLIFCAPRANSFLRVVHPNSSQAFADEHDEELRRCFSTLLGQVPGSHSWGGGQRPTVFWWPRFAERCDHNTSSLLGQLGRQLGACSVIDTGMSSPQLPLRSRIPPTHAYHLQGAASSRGFLNSVGFETVECAALADGLRRRECAFFDIEQECPLPVGR